MRKTSLIAGVGLLLLLVGCRQRITDFTVLSTKNFDLSRLNLEILCKYMINFQRT